MHGILFKAMKDFVVDAHGHDAWDAVRAETGLDRRVYLPIDTYDDDELFRLVEAVADLTDTPLRPLLEGFGRSAASQLLDTYGTVVGDDWDALDLVEHTEEGIHAVLRARNPDLDPPELACRRDGDARVTVVYRSQRRLCPVAIGLVRGVGDHYGESLTVSEERCMHEGGDRCELVVER